MVLIFSFAKFKVFLILPFSIFFMVRKLEVAVSNSIMEDIPVSFSLSVSVPFLLFLVHVLFLSFLLIPHFSCYYVA